MAFHCGRSVLLKASARPRLRSCLTTGEKVAVPMPVALAGRQVSEKELLKEYRFTLTDFLPSQPFNKRNRLLEELETLDMVRRRKSLKIPEFYVGSILGVTISVPYTPSRLHRFVGICIQREERGLRHYFVLRNCIQNEVLKLEKRLDDELFYLRDALPEYSTVPLNMSPVPHPAGQPVPINPLKVKMKPPPWTKRWEIRDIKGVEDFWHLVRPFDKLRFRKVDFTPWMKYDIIDMYKSNVTLETLKTVLNRINRLQPTPSTPN